MHGAGTGLYRRAAITYVEGFLNLREGVDAPTAGAPGEPVDGMPVFDYNLPMGTLLEQILALVASGQVRVSAHGYDELAQDGILVKEVIAGLSVAVLVRGLRCLSKGPLHPGAAARCPEQAHTYIVGHSQGCRLAGSADHRLQARSKSMVK